VALRVAVGPVKGPYRPPDCHRQLDQISVNRGAGLLDSIPGKANQGNLIVSETCKDWRRSDYSVNQSTLTASHSAWLEAL